MLKTKASPTETSIQWDEHKQTLICKGEWTTNQINLLTRQLHDFKKTSSIPKTIDASNISMLDSAGAFELNKLLVALQAKEKQIKLTGLDAKQQAIMDLVIEKGEPVLTKGPPHLPHFNELYLIGKWAVTKWADTLAFLAFIGEIILVSLKLLGNWRRIPWRSTLSIVQTSGCESMPIVAMMTFLIGIVLAYQLGVELHKYGGDVYTVDSTGIALFREFAPLITAIIMAGRTSTSFAALLGTMKVNEELDALQTMGVSPLERLVLPRLIGLLIALPLLTVWGSLFGILGSMLMTKWLLNIEFNVFLERFHTFVAIREFFLGMVKTPVFAMIVAGVGCFQGMQVAMTADSVGRKTTLAAVQAIFLIIVADAFFSILFGWKGL